MLLWTKKLKLHASIKLFTSTLNLSHVTNNSVHTDCPKHNLIYMPKTQEGIKKNPPKNQHIMSLNFQSGLSPYSFWLLEPLLPSLISVTWIVDSLTDTKCKLDVKKQNLIFVAQNPLQFSDTMSPYVSVREWLFICIVDYLYVLYLFLHFQKTIQASKLRL